MSDTWCGRLALEMSSTAVGDPRLVRRLGRMVERIAEQPGMSFPKLFDSAELEAAYRFFANPALGMEEILSGHYAATAARAREASTVLVLHDSTTLSFREDGQRRGLGRLITSKQSFFAHASLVVTADGTRRPLGVGALSTWRRGEVDSPENERSRWVTQCELVSRRLQANNVIHVMDREADDYALFARFDSRTRFIVRAQHDRVLCVDDDDAHAKLQAATATLERSFEREAKLSKRVDGKRAPVQKKVHPSRAARIAKLSIAATRVTLKRPRVANRSALVDAIAINVVRIWEPKPPADEAPISWTLYTSEPIDTLEQLAWIVDSYRTRWMIEEYFKALKTGCAFESRQLGDYEGLVNALAVLAPIACGLLQLRSDARDQPDAPATRVLTPTQLDVLRAFGRKRISANPTARDALLAVAALGGHLKSSGEPGWLTLGRGYSELLTLTRGWEGAKLQRGCDQG